ncbi:MAG: zf-HC2 domain-containing protein [Planctomycetes bacterium]|nr:zf-HC2 domain-containing protein [Planctomycetota bacterium]
MNSTSAHALDPVRIDCDEVAESLRPMLDGQLSDDAAADISAHIQSCPRCARAYRDHQQLHALMNSTLGARQIGRGFDEKANRRLLERRRLAEDGTSAKALTALHLGTGEQEEIEEAVPAGGGFLDSLSRQFGAAPWWIISGAFHALLILLVFLIGMVVMQAKQNDMVIVTNLEKQEKPPEPEKKLERDVIEKPVPIVQSEVVSDQQPIVTHEVVEFAEQVETNNDSDARDSKGEDGISDIWLGGQGTVGSIGVGGGGRAGAFGRPGGAGGRLRRAIAGGGGKGTESAVDKALEWLAKHQEADGHWDTKKYEASTKGDTACTGVALLAFLGAGHTEKIGKYKDNVQRAVKWLIAQQNAQGFIKAAGDTDNNYGHPMAALALAEASAMARQPETAAAAQKAVDYSVDIHQKEGNGPSEKFGWRYAPQDPLGDTSVSGWYIMQLKSAKVAGLKVDPAAFEGAMRFLDSVEVEKVNPNDAYSGHRYGYRRDGAPIRIKSNHGNTSIGILGRLFLGVPADEVRGGVDYFIKEGGLPRADHPEFYHWYYATLATFQVGGDEWKQWNEALKTALLAMQRRGGDEDGSWDPKGHSVEGAESQGGRVFTTAIGALCLEVYYRYLPMNR